MRREIEKKKKRRKEEDEKKKKKKKKKRNLEGGGKGDEHEGTQGGLLLSIAMGRSHALTIYTNPCLYTLMEELGTYISQHDYAEIKNGESIISRSYKDYNFLSYIVLFIVNNNSMS